jgi:hypothetical protein
LWGPSRDRSRSWQQLGLDHEPEFEDGSDAQFLASPCLSVDLLLEDDGSGVGQVHWQRLGSVAQPQAVPLEVWDMGCVRPVVDQLQDVGGLVDDVVEFLRVPNLTAFTVVARQVPGLDRGARRGS